MLRKKISHSTSDEELMSRINSGDTGAFNLLYDRYNQILLHYFHKMLGGDRDKAQDFLQALFLKLIEQTGQFKQKFNFKSWVFTIAHNMCKNEYRRMEIRRRLNGEVESTFGELQVNQNKIDDDLDSEKFKSALYEELSKIDPEHRSIFILRFQEHLTIPEISQITACPQGTVKSRLFYITKRLAKSLGEYHPHK